jgi:PQQ-dependent dehydrogenase (s-GDH family)
MKKLILSIILFKLITLTQAYAQVIKGAMNERFSVRIVADKLSDPWEVIYGPDNHLWITEARGYRVSKINPVNGNKTVVLDLTPERKFPRYDKLPRQVSGGKPWPQGGLMGMALHPQFLTGKPYVYLSYIYRFAGANKEGKGCELDSRGCFFKTKLVRYEYSKLQQKLINPIILCDTIPGSNDHNGGRLTVAPVNGKSYVFYSVGDLGAGQFENGGRANHAQDINYYEGKILRFNAEPDQDADKLNQWVPNDNPFNKAKQNAVWSYGHRNAQGLSYAVIGNQGRLYSSEHGPYSDDEVNIVEKGKNYGHPLILGYADGNYDGLAASVSDRENLPGIWHTTYPLIKSEQDNAKLIGANYRNPIKTLYPNSHSFLVKLFNATKENSRNDEEWSSEAPSSIEVYTSSAIPGWKNSVLLPALKGSKLVRLKLNEAGTQISSDTINYFKGNVRYRDIALSPDGKNIYLAVDSNAITSGPSAKDPHTVSYKGCIIVFSYTGKDSAPSKKPDPTKLTEKVIAPKRKNNND